MKRMLRSLLAIAMASVFNMVSFLPLQAQEVSVPVRPRVAVVLSGGGAKGAAHIGALKYLEEQGIPVDMVVGTSIGSIVGGLYSIGYSPDELATTISAIDWSRYMSNRNAVDRRFLSFDRRSNSSIYFLTVPFRLDGLFTSYGSSSSSFANGLPLSFVGGSNLVNLFNDLSIGYQDSIAFDSLPKAFACVGTDVSTGGKYVMRDGYLPISMRASMAIPGIFSPITLNGHVLVDGGMSDNFPVDVAREMGADIVIGIDISDNLEHDITRLQSLPAILNQMLNYFDNTLKQRNIEDCDVYIRPDITGYNMLSFNKSAIDTLVNRGYCAARRTREDIVRLRDSLSRFAEPVAHHIPRARCIDSDTFVVNDIHFNGVTPDEEVWLKHETRFPVQEPVTGETVHDAVSTINGTGFYTNITYNLHETAPLADSLARFPAYNMSLNLDHRQPHTLSIGLRYDTEEGTALLLDLGLNHNKPTGFHLDLIGRLSYNPKLSAKFFYTMRNFGAINVDINFYKANFTTAYLGHDEGNIYLQNRFVDIYLSNFFNRNIRYSAGIVLEDVDYRLMTAGSNLSSTQQNEYYAGFFGRMVFDDMDNQYFPTRGCRMMLDAEYRTAADESMTPMRSGFATGNLAFRHCISLDDRWALVNHAYAHITVGENVPMYFHPLVGGLVAHRYTAQHIPFVGTISAQRLFCDAAVLRMDLRANPIPDIYVTSMLNVLGGTDYSIIEHPLDGSVYFGYGLQFAYNTFMGPLSLTVDWSTLDYRWGAYASLGFTF